MANQCLPMMLKPGFNWGCLLALCLLAAWRSEGQSIYYSASSSALPQNTIGSVDASGNNQATLLTATGPGFNNVNRCTAVAVDGLNGRVFLVDAMSQALWTVKLDGTGLSLVSNGFTGFPTDLALDVLNQKIYFTTSSTLQAGNTVQQVDYSGANRTTLFTATGAAPGNGVSRCTALALDAGQAMLFLADAGSQKIWSLGLRGSGLTALAAVANGFPTGLALDTASQQVYFSVGSSQQSANQILRVSYSGSGLTSLFTASGGVQRCTALDIDAAGGAIYLSDAGAQTLWRVPTAGGAAAPVLSGLGAAAKKVRWYPGPQSPPSPGVIGISLSGQDVILRATNGFAGRTYRVLTSTNVALPLSSWLPVSSTVLAGTGNFSVTATNAFLSGSALQFYILQVQ